MNIDNDNIPEMEISPLNHETDIKNLDQTVTSSNSKLISSKSLTSKKWGMIEKPLSDADMKRNKIINDLGEKSTNTDIEIINSSGLFTIGDLNYLKLREEIKDLIKLQPISNEKKNKEKKINKATKLKLENCENNLKNKIVLLKELLKDNIQEKLYDDLMINFNYVEMRIIILMKLIELLTIKNKGKVFGKTNKEISQDEENNNKEEILLASQKILHNLKLYKNTNNFFKKICNIPDIEIELSQQLIDDFKFKIDELSEQVNIKLHEIANKKPKLIFDTKYDITIPEMRLKPHDTQLELINTIKKNINKGFLIFYKTLPGLGKTSMILSICSFIKKSQDKKRVIFCCSDSLESVRVQVLRVMFNFGIKFGIGNALDENKYVIKNSWNCKNDDERELIVCDYLSTYLILKEEKYEYLLFFDEPTVMTDKDPNTLVIKTLSKILYYLPKYTILSSATLPLLNEISNVTDNFKLKYPEAIFKEIVSNKTLIGCTIKDFNNKIIVPHYNCKNNIELGNLIAKIKKYPLLGKFYTLPYLMNLNEFMKNYKQNIDLDSIQSFEQENILENILLLLERISNDTNIDFEKFKLIEIFDINEDKIDLERLDNNYNNIDYTKFLTTHAYKYIGCCLIATKKPIDFVKKYFSEIIEKLKDKVKIKNINHVYQKYTKDLKQLNSQIEDIQTRYTSDNIIDEKINSLLNKKPKINFPSALQINTYEHIKSFAKYVKSYDNSLLKNVITPELIDITNFDVDEEINFLLYMGIGIYTPYLPSDYTDQVLDMLSDRQLAYIITDESFCYGANYQISNVIINDDLANEHSINTILQLIGRTSRIGKSWTGKVYLDNNTKIRLLNFFDTPDINSSNEGKNISTAFENIISEINIENIKKKELEEKKELERINNINKKIEEEKKRQLEAEEILKKKNKEIKEEINSQKDFWNNIRNNRIVNVETNVEKNKQVVKNETDTTKVDNGWGNLRNNRVTTPSIYTPGSFKKK